ncbi:hypothetical protein EK21DRAFT_46032, partial [Setomelanomma holmii]
DACVNRVSQAYCQEISSRLFRLPRELRDIVYRYMLHQDETIIRHYFDLDNSTEWHIVPPSPCSEASESSLPCQCSQSLVHFVNPYFIGREAAVEIFEAFRTTARQCTYRPSRSYERRPLSYGIYWQDLAEFRDRKLFHLGVTLHELLESMDISITLNFLTKGVGTSRRRGLSYATNMQLEQATEAMSQLSLGRPRQISFEFREDGVQVRNIPPNIDNVFRKLSIPILYLRDSGWIVRTLYHS